MNKKRGDVRKIEMVPLIDVIFLLLIFFLVTLNIIPIISKQETIESQYAMPVVTAEDAARVDLLIQLHQTTKDSTIHYLVVNEDLEDVPIARVQAQQDNLGMLRRILREHYYRDPSQIDFSRAKKVIICAPEWVPYEALFKVIQLCVDRGITYHFALGTVDDWTDRIRYSRPTEIVYNYIW